MEYNLINDFEFSSDMRWTVDDPKLFQSISVQSGLGQQGGSLTSE